MGERERVRERSNWKKKNTPRKEWSVRVEKCRSMG